MAQSGFNEETLRARRRALTANFCALGASPSPSATLAFQRELAAEILLSEAKLGEAARRARPLMKDHIRLIRAHGDGLAWLLLHPHAIRQFRKVGRPGQALSGQREALEGVFGVLEIVAASGAIALAADLTTELRLGDVIVVDDPEAPTIIECKNKLPQDGALLTGRVGRQLSRLQGTSEYLKRGAAQLHGEPMPRLCIESSVVTAPRWDAIRDAVDRALAEKVGNVRELEPGVVLWIKYDDEPVPMEMAQYVPGFRSVLIGAHVRFTDDDAPLMPPPLAWPLSEDARWHLTECDLSVVVLLDVHRFADIAAERGSTLVVDDTAGRLSVRKGDANYEVSPRFVDECVYCFHPIGDQVDMILELVDHAAAAAAIVPPNPSHVFAPTPEGGPQRVYRASSNDDLLRIAQQDGDQPGVVLMSGELLANFGPHEGPGIVLWPTGRDKGGEGTEPGDQADVVDDLENTDATSNNKKSE